MSEEECEATGNTRAGEECIGRLGRAGHGGAL